MTSTSIDGPRNARIAPRHRLAVALIIGTVVLGGCAGRPNAVRNAVVDYHEAADRYLRACLNARQDCSDSAEAHVKGLFTIAWTAARYQRGTRVYLVKHDQVWAEMLCGLREDRGCSPQDFNSLASMAQLERLDRAQRD